MIKISKTHGDTTYLKLLKFDYPQNGKLYKKHVIETHDTNEGN